MKPTFILTTLLTAFAAAAPVADPIVDANESVELSARAGVVRVQLDNPTTAAQTNINANGAKNTLRAKFGNLGNPILASEAFIVSGSATCQIFSDAAATKPVGKPFKNGDTADLTWGSGKAVNVNNGVIVCK